MYQQFAITIAVSVLISTFLALSFTPALRAILLKPMPEKGAHKNVLQRFFAWFNRGFGFVVDRYRAGVCNGALVIRRSCSSCCAIFRSHGVAVCGEAQRGFVPTEDEGRLFVTYQLPEAASTDRTLEVTQEAMQVLLNTEGVKSFAALPGLNVIDFTQRSNTGTIFCNLQPWADRKADSLIAENLAITLQQKFGGIEEATFRVIAPAAHPRIRDFGRFFAGAAATGQR